MAILIKKKQAEPMKLYPFGYGASPTLDPGKEVLGGKGASLQDMSALGLPVPPGFTIPCAASVTYNKLYSVTKVPYMEDLMNGVVSCLIDLDNFYGYRPLLSMRSGARVSLPGMMDSILNVGLTTETLPFWKDKIGERAALDSYRRLIQMYSSVAMGIPMELFVEQLEATKKDAGVTVDSELTPDYLDRLISRSKKVVHSAGKEFPDDTYSQVRGAIVAVFESWNNPRAIEYRKIHGYPDHWGTAVTVQSMVFGNMNDQSATGVLFSRNPSTGENVFTGEFLINAQGEDVVAGIRTPLPIAELGPLMGMGLESDLFGTAGKLEQHYKDMQDIEFTIQDGKLFILQTRNAKRSPLAAFRVAHDLAEESVISRKEAIGRVTQAQLLYVMQDTIDPNFSVPPDLQGIAAGGGIATGVAVFDSQSAVNCTEPCILIRKETDPDDIAGMNASVGILTATGGLTSHAAVVARGLNKSCVVGCTALNIQGNNGYITESNGHVIPFTSMQKVTLDGATGRVWIGTNVPVVSGGATAEVRALIGWSVESDTGISERLDVNAHSSQEDMLTAVSSVSCQSLYVDTALLEGVICEDFVPMQTRMKNLGIALESFVGGEIIVDLLPMSSHLQPVDRMLSAIFGDTSKVDAKILQVKATALIEWDSAVREKVVAKLPDNAGFFPSILVSSGIKTMGKVTTVADMLSAGGPIEVSDEVIKQVFGNHEAYLEIKALIETKNGKSLSGAATTPKYWYEFLGKAA